MSNPSYKKERNVNILEAYINGSSIDELSKANEISNQRVGFLIRDTFRRAFHFAYVNQEMDLIDFSLEYEPYAIREIGSKAASMIDYYKKQK